MIYAYAQLTITNPDSFAAYREQAGAALARHGGEVVQGSSDLTALDGKPDLPNIAAILAFKDRDSALGWINDPELADVHALRHGAGKSDIVLLG